MRRAPTILRPHADVAERVLAPGDPGRALRLAQWLLDAPKMLNHHRGLWGYTGEAADGLPLTVQATGLGGPSTAAVILELVELGARRVVRVGTACGRTAGGAPLGTILAPAVVESRDGTSRALGTASAGLAADAVLHAALLAGGAVDGRLASHDVLVAATSRDEAAASDTSSAGLLATAALSETPAAVLVGVASLDDGQHLADPERDTLEEAMGRMALAALAD